MRGLLIRVGIDKGYVDWISPCKSDGSFCYVPIPENGGNRILFKRFYGEFKPHVDALKPGVWPAHLKDNMPCHLDPDFNHLTYGDKKNNRGKKILEFLRPGDFIVFWTRLESIENENSIGAIIGYYDVSYIVKATEIGCLDWHRNAHTRRRPKPDQDDFVVFANPVSSGRLRKYIKFGEYHKEGQKMHIDTDLLRKWGPRKALCEKDGTPIREITRSGGLPSFHHPEKFQEWFFKSQKPELVHANNI